MTAEELDVIYQIRKALDVMHIDLAEIPMECERLKLKVRSLIEERDRARFSADQKWQCRKEINAALGIEEGMDADEALKLALDKIRELERLCCEVERLRIGLGQLVTTDHESKEAFISRVRGVLQGGGE